MEYVTHFRSIHMYDVIIYKYNLSDPVANLIKFMKRHISTRKKRFSGIQKYNRSNALKITGILHLFSCSHIWDMSTSVHTLHRYKTPQDDCLLSYKHFYHFPKYINFSKQDVHLYVDILFFGSIRQRHGHHLFFLPPVSTHVVYSTPAALPHRAIETTFFPKTWRKPELNS